MIQKAIFSLIVVLLLMPATASALTMDELMGVSSGQGLSMPSGGQVLGTQNISAHSVVVINQITSETLYTQNATDRWEPASLTKLLTALTVLDTKPNWNRICTIDAIDQVGGARLNATNGGAYYMIDLLKVMVRSSANNAAHALANQCAGMSTSAFIKKMNEKAVSLGATHSKFVDASGLSKDNYTTAEDLAKITNAAFSTPFLRDIAQQEPEYTITSARAPFRIHELKSTSLPLFRDPSFNLIAGKTGLLDNYNYAASTNNAAGQYLIVVVLGSPSQQDVFSSTKVAASLGFAKINSKVATATTKTRKR